MHFKLKGNDPMTPLPEPTAADLELFAKWKLTPGPIMKRILVEREIFRRTVACLLAAGYHLQVNDGEDDQTPITTDAALLEKESRATDEDVLHCYRPNESGGHTPAGFVHFIYGNTGWDVMSDWSTRLDEALEPVSTYADQIAGWF